MNRFGVVWFSLVLIVALLFHYFWNRSECQSTVETSANRTRIWDPFCLTKVTRSERRCFCNGSKTWVLMGQPSFHLNGGSSTSARAWIENSRSVTQCKEVSKFPAVLQSWSQCLPSFSPKPLFFPGALTFWIHEHDFALCLPYALARPSDGKAPPSVFGMGKNKSTGRFKSAQKSIPPPRCRWYLFYNRLFQGRLLEPYRSYPADEWIKLKERTQWLVEAILNNGRTIQQTKTVAQVDSLLMFILKSVLSRGKYY